MRKIVVAIIAMALCACSSASLSGTGGQSPSGSPAPFYSVFGWLVETGAATKVPTADTL